MSRVRGSAAVLALVAAFGPGVAVAADEPAAPETTFTATGMHYAMRDQDDFAVFVAAVQRGPLRLEARHNYEARDATSVFAGYAWSGGEAVTWSVTPLIGGLFGDAHGVVPAVEASLAWRELDFYVEAEYVRDLDDRSASYAYAWSELGWRPVEWLRIGLVGQRTRVVSNDRDLQRGVFGQLVVGPVTVGLYAFNPESSSRYVILSLGFAL